MSDYKRALESLCGEAGISARQAFERAVPYLDADRMSVRVLEEGYIPDMTTTAALANFFGVGVDTFLPDAGLPEGQHRTYLCGPITGVPDFMDRFSDAMAYLEKRGRHVFSPAHVTDVLPKAFMTRRNFMDIGLVVLGMCDEIAMLPGWQTHTGCQMELAYARANGMSVIDMDENQLREGARLRASGEKAVSGW